ncbi:MAG: class I SAM-dependent methyltransferase [Nanoarchaeota archaeon]
MDNELSAKDKIQLAIQTYNKFSKIYADYTSSKIMQFQLNNFISLLPEKGKILDAGSGSGRDSNYLKEEGLDVIPVDFSDGMIEEAKKLNVDTIKGNLLEMSSDDEFVGIWCMATLADIPKSEAPKLIKNFSKALKKDGILYIAVKKGDSEQIIEKERYDNSPRFYAFYQKKELNDLLISNGFVIIESTESNDEENDWIEVFAKKA